MAKQSPFHPWNSCKAAFLTVQYSYNETQVPLDPSSYCKWSSIYVANSAFLYSSGLNDILFWHSGPNPPNHKAYVASWYLDL